MLATQRHRVAILGLMLESNRFAPVITEDDYLKRVYLAGDEILEDLHSSDPKLPTEIRGFAAAMDDQGAGNRCRSSWDWSRQEGQWITRSSRRAAEIRTRLKAAGRWTRSISPTTGR